MYQEVDIQTAFLAALEGKTVLGISALSPKEIYSLTDQLKSIVDDSDRFIVDMPEPEEPAEPETVLLSAEEPAEPDTIITRDVDISIPSAPKKPVDKRRNKGIRSSKHIDDGKILALHNAGWPIAKIADEMGIGESTVYKHLYDIQKTPKGED